jgi:HlyD family secretion protein
MSSNLFRKAALDRLSSPEQLDVIVRLTGPKRWLALMGLFLVLGVVVIWGYRGSIATKVGGFGIIVRSGTVLNIVAPSAGTVSSIRVSAGDRVRANQVVASIDNPETREKIKLARAALDQARKERERNLALRREGAQLQVEALANDEANAQREIQEEQNQVKIATEQATVDEQLLAKGLITRQQTLQDQQKVVALNAQIESLRARIKRIEADQYTARTDPERFDQDMQDRVAQRERDLAGLEDDLRTHSTVLSPFDGQVIEMRADPGTLVTANTPILSVQPERNTLEVLVYLPSSDAKAIQPAMQAEISPSTVKREEYGFITGKVIYVGQFPASFDALMRNFQNETLVRSIMAGGPVTELRVTLDPDSSTPSGYKWSSSRGPVLAITSGTLCSVQVVTRQQPPVSLLFPFLKRALGLT